MLKKHSKNHPVLVLDSKASTKKYGLLDSKTKTLKKIMSYILKPA